MKTIRIGIVIVVGLMVMRLAFSVYDDHQHKNFVLEEEQNLRQELCSMEPSKREQFCENFTYQIDESTITCSYLGSGLEGDEHAVSTSLDWSRYESSDTTNSYLHCN